jgi:hypothetical protein
MNTHLARLASQAGFDIGVHDGLVLGNFSEMHRCQKLAELIIKECGLMVADKADVTREKWEGIDRCVREHFGVDQ